MNAAVQELQFGTINGHIIGRILKETVRRAINTIRSEKVKFEATTKQGYDGNMTDVFTTADSAAQEVYLRAFRECFPQCMVIAEEDSLTIIPDKDCPFFFTVDPLDGTRAFIRRQSHGVSTMVAMVDKSSGEVIAAYIGDINTQEIFGYRPDSEKVHRITDFDLFETLSPNPMANLAEAYILLRDPIPKDASASIMSIIDMHQNYEVMGSSIGTWFARLWKEEVGGLLLPPGFETPWDSAPVIGISLKLGYIFSRPSKAHASQGMWESFTPPIPLSPMQRDHYVWVTHPSSIEAYHDRGNT